MHVEQKLKELWWVDGHNLHIDFRWSTGERDQMQALAKELIDLKPKMILGMTTLAVTALVQETKTIPILFANIVDPLGYGATWRQRNWTSQFQILVGPESARNSQADGPCP